MEQIEGLVVLYFQNMGMPGYKQLRGRRINQSAHRRIVVARIAADVFDEHVDILAPEAVQLAIHQSEVAPVAVATDGTKGSKLCQPFSHFNRADVACMPNFIAGLEIMQIFVVPIGMGVTDDTYLLHELKVLKTKPLSDEIGNDALCLLQA